MRRIRNEKNLNCSLVGYNILNYRGSKIRFDKVDIDKIEPFDPKVDDVKFKFPQDKPPATREINID